MEGTARELGKGALRESVKAAYKRKYGSDLDDYAADPIYEIQPSILFVGSEKGGANPTRWKIRKSSRKK